MPTNPFEPPKVPPERVRFQFTLRTQLLLLVAVCLVADWIRRYVIVSIIFDSTANSGGAAEAAAASHWPYFLAETLILLVAIPVLLAAIAFSLLPRRRTFY